MEFLGRVGKIGLGLILLFSGLYLLFRWDCSNTLPRLLRRLPVLSFLVPYAQFYFKVNAMFFALAGLLTLFNNKFAALAQVIGSALFVLTYDNPFLASDKAEMIQRTIFMTCHVMVILALPSFVCCGCCGTCKSPETLSPSPVKKEARREATPAPSPEKKEQ